MTITGPKTVLGRAVNALEETLIALLLGLMTLVTFANVVARYVFEDNILWALEVTGFLNAWMILIGVGYCMKTGAHLGVDALVEALPSRFRKPLTLIAALGTLIFAGLMVAGAWNYWAPFANLPPLWGSWFPQAFFEVEDTPMPAALQPLAAPLNDGEPYEKLPRFVPYAILPIGMALFALRTAAATWEIWIGERDLLIASHEADKPGHHDADLTPGAHVHDERER